MRSALILFLVILSGLIGSEFLISQTINIGVEVRPGRFDKRFVVLSEMPPKYTSLIPALHKDGSITHTRFDTDEAGFIKPSAEHASPNLKIAFLGGSTTECRSVDESSRFPHRATKILEEKLEKTINSYNAGSSGMTTMQANVVLLAKVIPVRPDIVVLMETINDLTVLLNQGSYWSDETNRGLIVSYRGTQSPKQFARNILRDITDITFPYTYALINWALTQKIVPFFAKFGIALPALFDVDDFRDVRQIPRSIDPGHIERQFRESLYTFIATTRSFNIRPVLMTQFNMMVANQPIPSYEMQPNPIPWNAYTSLYQRLTYTIHTVGEETGTPVIDLAKFVPHSIEMMPDGIHLNTEASIMVASHIADSLEEIIRKTR